MASNRVDIRGVDGIVKTLRSLPAEVVSKNGGPVKLSLAKGARYLRDREREALKRVISSDWLDGESTGLLERSIIATRGKAPTGTRGERYLVRIKRAIYKRAASKPVTTQAVAYWKEYGTENQPARSFIRSTVMQHGERTVRIIVDDLRVRIDRTVKKLASQNSRV